MKKIILFFLTVVSFQQSYAGGGKQAAGEAKAQQLAGQISAQSGGNTKAADGGSEAVYQSATNSKKQNKTGQLISTMISTGMQLTGAMQMASGCPPIPKLPSCFTGIALIVGSKIFTQQAKNNAAAAASAADTMGQSNGWGSVDGGGGSISGFDEKALNRTLSDDDLLKDPNIQKAMDVNAFKSTMKDLTGKSGIDLNDPNATINVNGKDVKVGDLKDASSLQSAGLDPSGFNSALNSISADANKRVHKMGALTAASGYEEGGGRSLSSGSTSGSSSDEQASRSTGLGSAASNGRNPANANAVSGLSKDFNGDPIGVASDSIFNMMTRRYKLKEKQNSFIEINAASNMDFKK